jgi:hypothetical protein
MKICDALQEKLAEKSQSRTFEYQVRDGCSNEQSHTKIDIVIDFAYRRYFGFGGQAEWQEKEG